MTPWGFVRRVVVAAFEDNVAFLASALTFNAFLAVVPFALLLLAALGYIVHADGDIVEEVHGFYSRLLPLHDTGSDDPFTTAEDFFVRVVASRAQLSAFGLPLFLWFATQFFGALRTSLNEVFDTEENRGWLVGKGFDLLLVLITVVLVMANTFVSVPAFGFPWLGRWLSNLSAFTFGVVLFFAIYTLAPSRPVRWDTALLAAMFASLAFEVAKQGYRVYLSHFATVDRIISNTNAIALMLLIIWMFFTATVFLVGGEVAQTYDLVRRQRSQRAILA